MKRLALLIMFVVVGSTTLLAEEYHLAVGPYLMLKAGVNAGTIPDGTKTGVAFNGIPDLGAVVYIPFSKEHLLGMPLGIGYHTYAYQSKPNSGSTDDNTFVTKVHYLAISPNVQLQAFVVGFTAGFSPSGSSSNVSGTLTNDIKSSDMTNLVVDVHFGLGLPVVNTAAGRLDILLNASYMISGIASNSDYNPHPASMALGMSYLFNVQK